MPKTEFLSHHNSYAYLGNGKLVAEVQGMDREYKVVFWDPANEDQPIRMLKQVPSEQQKSEVEDQKQKRPDLEETKERLLEQQERAPEPAPVGAIEEEEK